MAKFSKSDLLDKPIIKSLLILAIPIMLSNILQSAYQFTDLFWVGKLGSVQVAAISVCFPIIMLFLSFGIGLSIAGSVLISQYKGKKDHVKLNEVLGQSVILALGISAIFSVIGYFSSNFLVSLLHLDPAVALSAVSYLQVYFLGTVFVFGYMSFQGTLRGVGEVNIPLYIVLGTVLLNLIIDPILIRGWKFIPAYGISGAAMATIITQGIAFFIALFILFKGRSGLLLRLKYLLPNFKLIKRLFFLGIPISFGMSIRFFAMTLMTYIVAAFGTIITAAYGVGFQIYGFIILPALGLSMATSTLVGQNLGAKRKDRAQEVAKKSLSIGFGLLSLMGVLIFIFAKFVVEFFVPGQTQVITHAVMFIRIMSFSFGFVALGRVFTGVFQGAGDMKAPMIISIISLWIFQLPFAYFVSKYFLGVLGIWLAIPLTAVISTIISFIWYKKGNWKNINLVHK